MGNSRGEYCYICGTKLTPECIIKQVHIDRRPREVHSRCALRREKALKDFR